MNEIKLGVLITLVIIICVLIYDRPKQIEGYVDGQEAVYGGKPPTQTVEIKTETIKNSQPGGGSGNPQGTSQPFKSNL